MSVQLNPAQMAAVERWGQDVCVVAGPGSGKTRVLIERFRWLVEEKGISPRRILAVTFTDKAATEIKKRLIEAFASSEERRAEIERAWVSTIHGFCTRLLKEHAIAANLDPDFTLVEEARSQVARRRIAERVCDDLLRRDAEPMRRLLKALDTGGSDLADGLLKLYEQARTAGIPVGSFRHPEAPADSGWNEVAQAVRVILGETPMGTDRQKQAHLDAHAWAREALTPGDRIALLDRLPRPSGLSGKSRAKAALQELKDRVAPAVLARLVLRENAGLYPLCLEALRRLHRDYTEWKRERALLDFNDLEEDAIALLEADAALRERVRGSFDQVLVDELQDTNRLQWRLIGLVRRPDNLFAVGDINQSIYYFRHAGPGVFREYRDSLMARGLAVDELRENYRSRAAILEAVNLTAPYLLGGVEPHRLEARREFPESGEPAIEFTHTFAGQEGDDAAEIEARWIARRIRELGRYGESAVLARTIGALAAVQRALDDFGVPSVISGGRSFYESREVRDLVAWLAVLVNPLDEISLATVLRSPLVGIPDETLLRLKMAGPMGESIAAGADSPRLAWFWRTVTNQRARCDEVAPDRLLAEALDASSYQDGLPGRALANIAKLLAHLRERWRRDPSPLAGIVEEFQLWRSTETEAEAATGEAANCVRLMSVHAAKGLEFPVVFLASMRSGPQNRKPIFCFDERLVLGAAWRHPSAAKGVPDPVHLAAGVERQRQEDGEEDRLLYVAMTRAERKLICSASPGGQGDWAKRVSEGLGLPTGVPKSELSSTVALRSGAPVKLIHTCASVSSEGLPEGNGAAAREAALAIAKPPLAEQHEITLPVTSVAQFAFCPRQYYLARYLRWPGAVKAPAESEPEADSGEWTASEFGTIVHELLAGNARPDAPSEAVAMRARFEASVLGRRAASASRVEREFDFLVEVEGAILRGQIDLWFEEGGELLLVDYKTDRVEPGEEWRHARRYVPQLRLYALAIEKLTGRIPDRAVLWYLRTGTPVFVGLNAEDLEAARAAIRAILRAQSELQFPLREGTHCLRCSYYRAGCPAEVPEESSFLASRSMG